MEVWGSKPRATEAGAPLLPALAAEPPGACGISPIRGENFTLPRGAGPCAPRAGVGESVRGSESGRFLPSGFVIGRVRPAPGASSRPSLDIRSGEPPAAEGEPGHGGPDRAAPRGAPAPDVRGPARPRRGGPASPDHLARAI